jgi:hypothetical protein
LGFGLEMQRQVLENPLAFDEKSLNPKIFKIFYKIVE